MESDTTAAGEEGESGRNFNSNIAKDEAESELTLVVFGDKNSIDVGPENILLHQDMEAENKFSSKLYDLCGRHISVRNLLGFPSIDQIPVLEEVHAYILLVANGPHMKSYTSGLQWFEKSFGKEEIAFVLTVITHKPDENIEKTLEDLRTQSSFSLKRSHTCRRTLTDANEITELLDKIDAVEFKKDPVSYIRWMFEDNKEQKEDLEDDFFRQAESKGAVDVSVTGTYKQPENILKTERLNFQKNIEELLTRLNLQGKLQTKMSQDILKISESVRNLCISEKDLPTVYLRRLIMLDYGARYISAQQKVLRYVQMSDTADKYESSLFNLLKSSLSSDQSESTRVHPMDVQMAVFHCSDSLLRQKTITKLSQCQYALPLLVPDPVSEEIECPLWTFRQITKTWKTTEKKGDVDVVTMKNSPIYKAEAPMVLFFRLGSLTVSKSQLMNSLINDRHNTFFHRNCPGSTKSCLLMDGVAEIAWYCPAGKPNDHFNDIIAFCNLHGDALDHEKPRNILTEKSSVTVVLVQTLDNRDRNWKVIESLFKSKEPLICLVNDDDCKAAKVFERQFKVGLKDRSHAEVSDQLIVIIQNIVSISPKTFHIESLSKVSTVRLDETEKICKNGKVSAMKILTLIKGKDIAKVKDTLLPCQGQVWHDWCQINKELHHLTGNIEKEKAKKENQLMILRYKQRKFNCSELIKTFTHSLIHLSSEELHYFLKWTQILGDALTAECLSSILQKYDETWSEVNELKKKDKSDQFKEKKTELEKLSKKLLSATFGLEHFFREMGQIYEAHEAQKKITHDQFTEWKKYPELAADLMISGHPLELMDGDAGHVPLTWISSVLEEVINKLGDQRVFVLSVLGVQSSGKSTMLNAMFGLEFAVSAGRCTKGAFMQLLELSEDIKKDFKFDHILVVDTEGLRALELEGNTLHHDNELATFVVGLGNLTLINIFGENPADMQDVLQIVVQAFMRMKGVKLSPRCVFVHQNVTDVAAAERNMEGKRRLQEKLDRMTRMAAEEEGGNADCFSDVIAFDVQKDVKYFAQLWEGSPPMAPPNPGYSESIQELKKTILSKASRETGIKLSHFKSKISALWEALMNENFVFSFKNIQEVSVYRQLEVQYGNWTWELRSEMLKIENQLFHKINNRQLDRIETSYIHKEISKMYEDVKKSLAVYFKDNSEKEILVQWQSRFEKKIQEFLEELINDVKRKLGEVIQQKKAMIELDNMKKEFDKKLLQESKELAQKLKSLVNDEEELKLNFDHVWSQWVEDLTKNIKPIGNINLEEDQSRVLQELGVEWKHINESKRSERYKKLKGIGNYDDYIRRSMWRLEFGKIPYQEQEKIRSLIITVEEECLRAIISKPVALTGYSQTYLQQVAKSVQDKVRTFESDSKYQFRKDFIVDLSLYVFERTASWISTSHKTYQKNNDAQIYLDSKKTEYYNIFQSYCKGNSSSVVFGEIICAKLKESVTEAVCIQTGTGIANEMKASFPAFKENRLKLEKHVLTSLAEKEDFNGFITYIRDPREQVETFIREEVKRFMFTTNKEKVQNILKKNVDDVIQLVSQALSEATQTVNNKKGNLDVWLKEFSDVLNSKLTLESICCQNFQKINNFDFLKEEIENRLVQITEELKNLSLDEVNTCRQRPDEILIHQLCSCCWEKCPFCAAVCTNTLKDHSPDKHSVPFHRPSGVKGWHTRGTVDLVIDFCTTLVASDRSFYPEYNSEKTVPYKQYPNGGEKYASWSITPDASKLTYWKWFVCRFEKELEDYYKKKFQGRGEIPKEWRKCSKEEAIESLDEM